MNHQFFTSCTANTNTVGAQTISYLLYSGGSKVGGAETRPKWGPLMVSSYSANRDKHF